jgi:hypothetical protein
MLVIDKNEFNETYRNQLLFILLVGGGLGNYIGCFFSGIDFYYMHNLNTTHKILCISYPCTGADIHITDLFAFNDNIILLNISRGTALSDALSELNYPDNMWRTPHPYNHLNSSPQSDIKTKSIFFSTNALVFNNFNNLILGKKYFKMKILENIEQKIISFVKDNNIDKNTLGMHYRGTDKIPPSDSLHNFVTNCISTNYKKYFICSDEPETEKYLVTKFNGSVYNKNTLVVKKSGFENCGWVLNDDETKMASQKIKDGGKHNVYRSLEQCVDGFIDAGILGHCKIISNQYSSFDELADCIFNLFFTNLDN